MEKEVLLDDFLSRNLIDRAVWDRAEIEWETLKRIAADHESQVDQLGATAAMVANIIQKFGKVHSVRWRVKAVDHLLEKIVRKRADGLEKYQTIDEKNYHEIVTDLIGIRALHLFKDDCIEIDNDLKAAWSPQEMPVAYIRDGDSSDLTARLRGGGFEIKSHPAGYRSVHYVFSIRPLKREIFFEVQVRTIFEEGWSEIDHTVRYPNYSDNELVGYFLAIFNRMAGSADEMGGFVRGLTKTLERLETALAAEKREKQKTLDDMEKTLTQMEAVKQQDAESKRQIAALRSELSKLKSADVYPAIPSWLSTAVTPDASRTWAAVASRPEFTSSTGLLGVSKEQMEAFARLDSVATALGMNTRTGTGKDGR